MTDEPTDANLVARLRLPYSVDPPLAKIAADRLEQLAAENANWNTWSMLLAAERDAFAAECDRLRERIEIEEAKGGKG